MEEDLKELENDEGLFRYSEGKQEYSDDEVRKAGLQLLLLLIVTIVVFRFIFWVIEHFLYTTG